MQPVWLPRTKGPRIQGCRELVRKVGERQDRAHPVPAVPDPLENAAAEANDAELAVARAGGGKFLPDPVLCITGTLEDPGTVLYGRDHLQRISVAGQAENLALVQLPADTWCVPIVGGVMVYLPGQRTAR